MTISTERQGSLLLIAFNRPDKRNAFDSQMLAELAAAYTELDRDESLHCGVIYAHGPHFTAGLDLPEITEKVLSGQPLIPADTIDPWAMTTRRCRKPLVVAIHGTCLTLGIELALAADIRIATEDATFAQLEVARGIFPFGGATLRFPHTAGWGDAMRWILTGDEFDATTAQRLGLVQEIVAPGDHTNRAIELAERIAAQAPLGVQAVIRHATLALSDPAAATTQIQADIASIFSSTDATAALDAFKKRKRSQPGQP